MRERFEYVLKLKGWNKPADKTMSAGLSLRTPENGDRCALAELMLESYRNTIDYEDETIIEAVDEVERYFAASPNNRALLEYSMLLTDGIALVSACLVMYWNRRNCPFIGYVISHPLWKRQGLAIRVVGESLGRLAAHGHHEVRTIITKGNLPSEGLFLRLGFAKVGAE